MDFLVHFLLISFILLEDHAVIFFFSSRRRHTRFDCWSSDVCSSDLLVGYNDIDNDAAEGVEAGWRYEPERLAADWEPTVEILSKEEIERREGDRERQIRRLRRRSEERRVGKECRSRWSPYH